MVAALRESGADVLVCYLPVGSQQAAEFYAQAAIDAGVAFVNALPVFIAGTKAWADKFTAAGVPIVGDDIKSQVGATITHRVLAKLFEDRGVQLDRTMQLNVGGNMDFKNMLERERLESKKISKTQSVTSQVDRDMGQGNVHIGPSDHVPWLSDRKWAYVRLEGRAFGDVPLSLEYKLEVWDSPNSAGIIIDAVRAAKIAKDRGIGGPILSASSYFMKSPPVQYRDSEAHDPSRRSSAATSSAEPSRRSSTTGPASPPGDAGPVASCRGPGLRLPTLRRMPSRARQLLLAAGLAAGARHAAARRATTRDRTPGDPVTAGGGRRPRRRSCTATHQRGGADFVVTAPYGEDDRADAHRRGRLPARRSGARRR